MNFTTAEHHDTYSAIQGTSHKGHTVLIAGASRGIGLATVVSFAKAGASAIALAAQSNLDAVEAAVNDAATSAGHPLPQILKLPLDVTSEENVAEATAKVEQQDSAEWWKL